MGPASSHGVRRGKFSGLGREGGKEGGREGGREGDVILLLMGMIQKDGRKGGRERGREGGRTCTTR